MNGAEKLHAAHLSFKAAIGLELAIEGEDMDAIKAAEVEMRHAQSASVETLPCIRPLSPLTGSRIPVAATLPSAAGHLLLLKGGERVLLRSLLARLVQQSNRLRDWDQSTVLLASPSTCGTSVTGMCATPLLVWREYSPSMRCGETKCSDHGRRSSPDAGSGFARPSRAAEGLPVGGVEQVSREFVGLLLQLDAEVTSPA